MSETTIGKRIANSRRAKTLSQAKLAQKLYVSSQAVGKWERGESLPDLFMLVKLAAVLGTDANSLLNMKEQRNHNKATDCSCTICHCCNACTCAL